MSDESSDNLPGAAAARLRRLLQGKFPPPLPEQDDAAPEERELIGTVNQLIDAFAEIQRFILPLSQGELRQEIPRTGNVLSAPFKELHARLLHLTWQTEQVSRGDYHQRIDFMGDFSVAFNTMVATLAEREQSLHEKVDQLAERSAELTETNEKLHLESGELPLGASIGISLYPRDGEELEELTRGADLAMYQAKQNGKGRVSLGPAH
ncbi:MAG TPA: diguanylate cyclase [Desulfuromonadales bacterium]|nr:diguanylate cyclase [Desulfuromonadales bacterium]